ncbi:MAG TPA: hypothetical protein VN803_06880 [Gemmatimonadales bacterium]|nr:hypothetical protein [Gemmatimonadales bacterium]
MAKFGGADAAFFLIDGYSVLGVVTEIADEQEVVTEDAKPLGSKYPKPTPTGDLLATLSQSGFFDDATDSINDALSGQQGTARVVNYGFEGNTKGKTCVGLSGSYASKYTRVISKGQLHKANASYSIAGVVERPLILHELAAEAGDGNTEGAGSQDGGASSANGGSGFLQVSSVTLSGRPNVTAKVRHSADDVTYADLITFTAVTARTAERKTVASTVNRHLATSWAWGGAGGAPSFTFMIAFHRNA